jgi:hypothetical protein
MSVPSLLYNALTIVNLNQFVIDGFARLDFHNLFLSLLTRVDIEKTFFYQELFSVYSLVILIIFYCFGLFHD